ncbi:MAG: hypothetical protein WC841_02770 [Candidatus Shapirobacteria bacterium]|jgi:hypothetical protein
MVFPFLSIIGIVLFLYLTWRNLRDSYRVDDLITFSWLAVLAFLIGGRVTYGLANWGEWSTLGDWVIFYKNRGLNLAGGYVILLMIVTVLAQKYSWKLWPFLEDMTNNMLILVMGVWLAGVDFGKIGVTEGAIAAIFVLSLLISTWVKNRYRSFVWYRSGRKGFRFFFANMVFFMLLAVYFLIINKWVFFGVLLFAGLINLGGLFILGEVLDPLLVKIKRKKS